jgi:xanthine dehydrogenase accessory factor
MLSIWEKAAEELTAGRHILLATILAVRGSSPRHVGTRFILKTDGAIEGTIGGGLFEANVREAAQRSLIEKVSGRLLFSFMGNDASSDQMICGGEADVLLEYVAADKSVTPQIIDVLRKITKSRAQGILVTGVSLRHGEFSGKPVPHLLLHHAGASIGGFPGDLEVMKNLPEPRRLKAAQLVETPGILQSVLIEPIYPRGTVYIFGAGHVGTSLAHLAGFVNFEVVVLDDRSEFADFQRFPESKKVCVLESFEESFSTLPVDEDSYIVIVTRGHLHDKTVLRQALGTKACYLGMIGSRRKTKLIFDSLLMEGFTPDDIRRVHAPIGLPIGGETPEEIGVSIVAEMISVRHAKEQPT